jgi:hypothetical protein
MPARRAYWRLPSALAYHARMAWRASYCSRGGSWRLRALCCARVQAVRVGQAVQSLRLNCTLIQGFWAWSVDAVQGEGIEGGTQRLSDEFQAVEHPDGRQHMRGIGPLLSTGLKEPQRATPLQQFVSQVFCSAPGA